jgi:hypothetical protein
MGKKLMIIWCILTGGYTSSDKKEIWWLGGRNIKITFSKKDFHGEPK